MKHKILFLLVAILFFGIIFSACKVIAGSEDEKTNTQTTNTDDTNKDSEIKDTDNTDTNQNSSVVCPQYFWGKWTRMDNGTVYEIGESDVNVVSAGSTTATYKITSKTDESFTCSLGTFTKDTDNVLKIGSIPVFRNGGSNIEYSVSLVGFSDTLSRAATATSTASTLSGISGKATNETYSSYSEEATSDSDGKLTLHSPVADTPNTITVSASDGTTVTATVTPKNAGENAGTIAVATSGRYSLKVSGEITTDTSEDDGYLYAGKTYDMTITVANITDVTARPGDIIITSEDSRITVTGETQNEIASFKSPSTKKFSVQVTCSSLEVPYLDSGLNVQFEDADGYIWNDFIPLRIYKENELIQVYAIGIENDDCSLNGFVMYPDGKSKYFSVPSGTSTEIEVPSFPATEPYKLAFSGAALGATVQQSTEMKYSVGVNTSAIQDFSSYKLSEIVNLYEPNNSEDKAVQVDSSSAVVAYLETDDIDFYSVAVNSYGSAKTYIVKHYLEDTNCDDEITYSLDESEILSGTIGYSTQAAAKYYEGFTAQSFEQKTVSGTESTTVKIYYNRNPVTLKFDANGGEFSDGSTTKKLEGKYGNTIYWDYVDEYGNTYYCNYIVVEKSGYTFSGWKCTDEDVVSEIETFPSASKTYTAQWEAITYTITYNLNGGTNADENPASYTIESNTITLSDATRTESYYEFGGWYTDDSFENQITEIASGSVGNITLYAKWKFDNSQLSSQLSALTSSDKVTFAINIKITQEDIEEIAEAINETAGFVTLDFSNATGANELKTGGKQ